MTNRNLWSVSEVEILLKLGSDKASLKLGRSFKACCLKHYRLIGKSGKKAKGNPKGWSNPNKGKKYKKRELVIVWHKNPDFEKQEKKKVKAVKNKISELSTIKNSGDLYSVEVEPIFETKEFYTPKGNQVVSTEKTFNTFLAGLIEKVENMFNLNK